MDMRKKILAALSVIGVCFLGMIVMAALVPGASTEPGSENTVLNTYSGMKIIGVLALVFLLLAGFAWAVKTYGPSLFPSHMRSKFIKVHEISALTPKARVGLIEVEGKKILVGITDQTVQRIAEFEHSDHEVSDDLETPEKNHRFAAYLKKLR